MVYEITWVCLPNKWLLSTCQRAKYFQHLHEKKYFNWVLSTTMQKSSQKFASGYRFISEKIFSICIFYQFYYTRLCNKIHLMWKSNILENIVRVKYYLILIINIKLLSINSYGFNWANLINWVWANHQTTLFWRKLTSN